MSSSSTMSSPTSAKAEPFVVGGLSAMLASSCIHPVDLAKVRLQLFAVQNPGVPRPSFVNILRGVAHTEGFTAIYSGLSASLLRQAIYGTARIGLHRSFSNELQRRNDGKPLSFATKTLSGMASGSLAVCVGTPMDVALVRMQADSMRVEAERRGYRHVFDALFRVAREEGFTALYSGLLPGVLRGMAMNVGMLACYDQASEMIGRHVTKDTGNTPSLQTQLLSSLVAGVTASGFSLPFDLMKSRLQDGRTYSGIIDVFTKVLTKEGPLAFWTGFGAYYLRTAPHSMIILLSQEPIKAMYRKATSTKA